MKGDDIVVAVLAGGLGARLASVVPDLPKVLTPVCNRPFLDILLDQLSDQGIKRVVLLLGHRSDQVVDYLQGHPRQGMKISTIIEPKPLGTAGAVANARNALGESTIVMNGDTYIDLDIAGFSNEAKNSKTNAAILTIFKSDTGRFGRLELDQNNHVISFHEKAPGAEGWINAGIYYLKKRALDSIYKIKTGSIEHDYFEKLPRGSLLAHPVTGRFVDIGVPESLAEAESVLRGGV